MAELWSWPFSSRGRGKKTTQTGHCVIRNGTRGALSSVVMRNLETDCDLYTSFIAQNQEARQRNRLISFSDIALWRLGKSKGHAKANVGCMLPLLPVFTPTPQDQITRMVKIPSSESSFQRLGRLQKVNLVEPSLCSYNTTVRYGRV